MLHTQNLPLDAKDYTLRLVGGSREGVLEVAFNGIWGTVCRDALWDADNAEVACKELGLTTEDDYSVPTDPMYASILHACACASHMHCSNYCSSLCYLA